MIPQILLLQTHYLVFALSAPAVLTVYASFLVNLVINRSEFSVLAIWMVHTSILIALAQQDKQE